jgi:hypothetical protein
MVKAAVELGTCIVMPVADITSDIDKFFDHIIPCLGPGEIDEQRAVLAKARLVAIDYTGELPENFPALKARMKNVCNALTIVRLPAVRAVEQTVSKLAHSGAEIIHVVADYRGKEVGGSPPSSARLIKDIIRAVHMRLVGDRIRDEVTIIASGGIAMAEHVPKAMLCGADLTAVDLPLLIALGARLYEEPERFLVLPEGLDEIPLEALTQRIVNLMGAWHSQLLEMMGAMGIREVRRLRGETGRAIFFEEIDNDTFGRLFRKREVASI